MLESKIERDSVKAAKASGWYSFKVLSQLNKGLPDRAFLKDGKTVYIEYKRPGEIPTLLQARIHKDFAAHGVPVYVCHSVEETMEVLSNALKS